MKAEIDDEERKNAASPLDLDVDTTEIVTDMVLNNREKRVADLGAEHGDHHAEHHARGWRPVERLRQQRPAGRHQDRAHDDLRRRARATRPNTMLMGYLVFEALKLHPDIKEIVKYTERAIVTAPDPRGGVRGR